MQRKGRDQEPDPLVDSKPRQGPGVQGPPSCLILPSCLDTLWPRIRRQWPCGLGDTLVVPKQPQPF